MNLKRSRNERIHLVLILLRCLNAALRRILRLHYGSGEMESVIG